MKYCFLILSIFTFEGIVAQDSLPYENKENYKFELDYNFKSRPIESVNDVQVGYSRKPAGSSSTLLPYVKVFLTFNNLPKDRYKVKIVNNLGNRVYSKKLKPDQKVVLDMGYANDIKDGIGPHRYDIYFENKEKEKLSKIVIDIDSDGHLKVNDQLYGKI